MLSRRKLLELSGVTSLSAIAVAACGIIPTSLTSALTGPNGISTVVTDLNAFITGVQGAMTTITGFATQLKITIPASVSTTVGNGIAALQTLVTNISNAETAVAAAPFVTQAEAAINSIVSTLEGWAGVPVQIQTIVSDVSLAIETLLPEILSAAGIALPGSAAANTGLTPAQARAMLAALAAK